MRELIRNTQYAVRTSQYARASSPHRLIPSPPHPIHRRGNAILEAALVLPILLALAFGTIEFGHFFFIKHSLQGAAREGVRAAILSDATNASVNTAVSNALTSAGLQNSGYTVTLNPSDVSDASAGTSINVTVQCTWGTVGMRPLALISANKAVSAVAVMRKE